MSPGRGGGYGERAIGHGCSISINGGRKQRDRRHDPKEKGSPSRLWKNLTSR